MKVEIQPLEDGITLVELSGRLDLDGVRTLEGPFTFETTTRQLLAVVNLAGVSFLASIGLRTLLSTARAQSQRGGKLVLAAADPLVRKVIETSGIDQLIPTYASVDEARAALLAG
jgi:anti-sigma B factor antagonist